MNNFGLVVLREDKSMLLYYVACPILADLLQMFCTTAYRVQVLKQWRLWCSSDAGAATVVSELQLWRL